jgi:hypothetical protein
MTLTSSSSFKDGQQRSISVELNQNQKVISIAVIESDQRIAVMIMVNQ